MKKNWPLLPAFCLLAASTVFAKQSSAPFLEIPSSVRAGGMADSFTALADEPLGIGYNPAGISFVETPYFSFLHQAYFQDTDQEVVAGVLPFDRLSIGVAPAFIHLKDEPIYDSQGNDTGAVFRYNAFVLPVAASVRLADFAVGASVKNYAESIGGASQNAYTADAGLIYNFEELKLGLSALNMTGSLGGYDLPRTYRAGAAIQNQLGVLALDASRQAVMKENSYGVGLEIPATRYAFCRVGYRWQDAGGFSAGLGFNFRPFLVDYAYSSYGEVGNTHRVALSYRFAPKVSITPLRERFSIFPSTNSLAVADLEARDGTESEAAVATKLIQSEFVKSKQFLMVDRQYTGRIVAEQEFQMRGYTTEEYAVKIGQILNVRKMLVGTVSKIGKHYFISLSCVDVETAKIEASDSIEISSAKLLPALSREIARRIIDKLIQ